MPNVRVHAMRWVPPFAQGLVRDLRVRWALREAGIPYEVVLHTREEQLGPAYRAVQPFGQIPAYEEDGLVLFESAAICWHVAERGEALLPVEPTARVLALQWAFAALNTIEPPLQALTEADLFHAQEAWAIERRPALMERATKRLANLARVLEGRECLGERFTVADLLMTTVLRIPRQTELVERFPALHEYRTRHESRPAFRTALDEQLATFRAHGPPPTVP